MMKHIGSDSRVGCVLDVDMNPEVPWDKSVYGHALTNHGSIWNLDGRYFDGTNDYIGLGTWDLTGIARTVSFWFNSTNTPSSLSDIRPFSGNYYDISFGKTPGYFTVYIHDTAFKLLNFPLSGFSANVWYNITITSNTNNLNLYIDGILVDTNNIFVLTSHPYNTNIGADYTGIDRNFSGLINDVRIYNRVLSREETLSYYINNNLNKLI